jgi:hypothetical protein
MRARESLEQAIMLGKVAGYMRQGNHGCDYWTVPRLEDLKEVK